jgi:ATP-dependent Clp endopeptidase proteolytic subunit ClpP
MSRNKTWFNITANAATGAHTIDIFDEIGLYGVSTKDFITALRAAGPAKSIRLNLDSPGGDMNDGFTIYDAIRAHGGHVSVSVIGMAASMASIVMLAGDRIEIAENGRVMIHRPNGGVRGNPDDIQAYAEFGKQLEQRAVALYMSRTGKDEAAVKDWMKSTTGTWFIGQQAVDAGFVDAVMPGVRATAFKAEWANKFEMLPPALFDTAAPPSPSRTSTPSPMKAILALASLVGITVKGDETEDQLTALIAAHRPSAKNVVIDFEDEAVKSAFTARITEATKDDKAKITALEAELVKITALLTNGAAGAAGGNAPVKVVTTPKTGSLQDQFAAITDPAERTRFYNANRAALRKPSSYFKAA